MTLPPVASGAVGIAAAEHALRSGCTGPLVLARGGAFLKAAGARAVNVFAGQVARVAAVLCRRTKPRLRVARGREHRSEPYAGRIQLRRQP
jgi:hypothetical protein